MIGQFTALLAEKNMNIEVMTNKSRKEYAYTMLDVDGTVSRRCGSAVSSGRRRVESKSDQISETLTVKRAE